MEHFILFDSWTLVGSEEFALIHSRTGWRDMLIYVTPLIALFVVDLLLLRHRPAFLPKTWLWVSIGCHIVTWVSSAFVQVPLQLKLYDVQDLELLNRLIVSDWIRLSALILHTLIALATVGRFTKTLTTRMAPGTE